MTHVTHSRRGRGGWLLVVVAVVMAVLAALCTVAWPGAASAQPKIVPDATGETVDEVRVIGNRRANLEEIRYNIRQKAGQPLDLDTVSKDIKRIYRMGFFDDIQVDAETIDGQLVLVYRVLEKPAIASIKYVGNDELDEDEIAEKVDLRVPSILDLSKVKANAEKIRQLYVKEGYFLAEVEPELIERDDGDVEVEFHIREYSKVTIREIDIVGNTAISDEELKGNIFTRESSLLGFLTGAGEYKQQEFKRDLQRLAFYYADNGYPDARVSDPQIQLSEDRSSMYITVRVDEGELYEVSEVDVAGDLLFDKDELFEVIGVESGETFRLSKVFQDVKTLSDMYKDEGYAYVSVEPKRKMDPETNTVGLVYDINKGKRVRIGQISLIGNQKTADKVIRRELLIDEGDIYNGTRVEASQRAVQRLGFFEKVSIKTTTNEDERYIDLLVEVTERATGTFQVGAGFSSVESFIATIQVSQDNFLGRGQRLVAQATFSGLRQLFNVQFFEPHLFDSDWRFRATVFNFEFLLSDFTRASTGGTLGFGYPLYRGTLENPFGERALNQSLILDLTYTIEDVGVEPGGRLGRQQRNVGSLFKGGLTSSIGATLAWDTRDNQLFPTSGWIYQGGVEFADDTLFSENEFTRTTLRVRHYFPIFFDFVLKFNVELGWILNPTGDAPVPIFERFFVGGPNSVRGFERSTLGPTRGIAADVDDPAAPLTQFNIGGNKQFIFNAEIEFPILTSVGIKGVVFADAGNAFDNDQDLNLNLDLFSDPEEFDDVLRTAVGFGLRWLSPIGPLRFEWGFPLAPQADEDDLVFEFSIGNSF